MSLILTINPGSTSTKIAVFDDRKLVISKSLQHPNDEIAKFEKIADQYEFRKEAIVNFLKENNIDLKSLAVIVGRGGLLKPIKSGVYEVNDAMKKIDKAVKSGVIKKNTAARKKSRLMEKVNGSK